ncbi:MAG TPA: hypothetical protein VIM25_10785, partial [Candidatus Limnocylindrales bacterium]
MSWQDFVTISPLVAGILTAAAILVADLIRPGRTAVAVGTALIGLAITAAVTIAVGGTPASAFGGGYKVDDLTRFLDLLFIAVIAMTILVRTRLPRAARPARRRVRGDPRLRDDRRDVDLGIGRPAA